MELPAWLSGRRRPEGSSPLLGYWQRVGSSTDEAIEVEVQFHSDGQLRYCMLVGDKWQIMKLTYRLEGDTLLTNQPSAPREEKTRYWFKEEGTLVVEFAGQETTFHRGQRRAPAV